MTHRFRTAACCVSCWNERHPDRPAVRMVEAERERCCYCWAETTSGIYVRERCAEARLDGVPTLLAVDENGVPLETVPEDITGTDGTGQPPLDFEVTQTGQGTFDDPDIQQFAEEVANGSAGVPAQ